MFRGLGGFRDLGLAAGILLRVVRVLGSPYTGVARKSHSLLKKDGHLSMFGREFLES